MVGRFERRAAAGAEVKGSMRMRRKLSVAVIVAGVGAVPGLGWAESLEDALVAAYNTNPTLLAERANLRATDETVAQAVSGWRPNVVVNGQYGIQSGKSKSVFDTGGITTVTTRNEGTHPLSAQVEITQPIFTGLRPFNDFRSGRSQVRAGRETLKNTEQQVFLAVVQAYADVLRDQEVVALSQNNVRVLDRQLEAANDRFRVGEITRTDVAQAEARRAAARSNLTQSEAQLTQSRAAYERAVGQLPGTLDPLPALPSLPASEDEALALAMGANPSVEAARHAEDASRFSVYSAQGELLPRFDVRGELSTAEDGSTQGGQVATEAVTFRGVMPLYQAGAVYSRIRQAKQINSRDRIRIAEAERQVSEAVANAWEGLRSAQATIRSSEEQVRANEIAFDGVQQEALVGSRTTLDVLDAEQELLDSRVALVSARRNEHVAAFELLSVVGALTAGGLGLPVDVYDAEENYKDVRFQSFGGGID